MDRSVNRRDFIGLMAAGIVLPSMGLFQPNTRYSFRIRTITAGVELAPSPSLERIESAFRFLDPARKDFEDEGYEVQTLRIATQPFARYFPDWSSPAALDAIRAFDRFATERNVMFNIGPVITGDDYEPGFADWAARVIQETSSTSFTVSVASPSGGIQLNAVRAAAEAIAAIGRATPGGEGNFRFAATAFCPPGTPFFPAAWHEGEAAFAIGLESPGLLQEALGGVSGLAEAKTRMSEVLDDALSPVEVIANRIADQRGRRYLGIDASPAPGLESSIGQVIETMIDAPFGSPSTLSACAAITDVLKGLSVQTCGYSGLMLPVLEDPVLARRAAEGRYDIPQLLLYSSVCGTGLDVVPLPGDSSSEILAAIIGDVAALSTKYRKPLSARLFPVPGKQAGDAVHFENPFLTDSVVMGLG